MELVFSVVDHCVFDLVEVDEGKEEIDERMDFAFGPVQSDEGLIDVARLVPPLTGVRREARVGVGAWGGLSKLAQEVP